MKKFSLNEKYNFDFDSKEKIIYFEIRVKKNTGIYQFNYIIFESVLKNFVFWKQKRQYIYISFQIHFLTYSWDTILLPNPYLLLKK